MTTHWTARAACAARLDLPWTADTAQVHPLTVRTMQSICASCPVALDCLAAVDALDITGGFWAGRDRDPNAPDALTAPAWATGDEPAVVREPGLCWHPRRRHGRTYQQGAYLIQRDDAGAWHLGGVA